MGVKFGVKTSQWDVTWDTLLGTWERADQMEAFDSAWLFDHFVGIRNEQPTDDGAHEGWTAAAALASRTRRLQFGHLVLGNTHRHPALLARMATTLDHVSGPDRVVIGLGAGWTESEHAMFGWDLPSIGDRLSMLESSVRILKGMWRHPEGFSFAAGPYVLRDAKCQPPPLTVGGPPIWLGTQGLKRGLRIVAELADGWNANGDVAAYRTKRDALIEHCEAIGRDVSSIEISTQIICGEQTSTELIDLAAQFIEGGVQHVIFGIRASDGADALDRLASDVVAPLRERYPG